MKAQELLNCDRSVILHFAEDLLRTPQTAANRWRRKKQGEPITGYIGWVGHSNLGDEAIFEAVRNALPGSKLIPLLPEPGERLIGRLGFGPAVFDSVLLGGGTLINCAYVAIARRVRELKVPLYTIGTGVGSHGFDAAADGDNCLEHWKPILDGSPFLSVRGPLSRKMLQHGGIPDAEVIGDPALGFALHQPPRIRSRRRLLINLAQQSGTSYGSDEYRVFRDIAGIAAQFLESGGEVVGVALGDRDHFTLNEFRAQNDLRTMWIEDHRRSSKRFLETAVGSVALIGVRLHSAVLAHCVGVPSILLAYRSKCQDYMSSMEADDFAVPLSAELAPPLLRAAFDRILSEPDLGERIYRKALFWKEKQKAYYARLLTALHAPAAMR